MTCIHMCLGEGWVAGGGQLVESELHDDVSLFSGL